MNSSISSYPALDFADELAALRAQGLFRELRSRPSTGARWPAADGGNRLNFSSNDYLGLANDPRLCDAACDAVRRWGCGATASRLMAGHLELHAELEAHLATWLGAESALVFGSGYLANLGLVSCLAQSGAALFMDRLNHASLIDGARLANVRIHRYAHADPDALDALLRTRERDAHRRIVLTESVFSMDGDAAPLRDLARVCIRHGAGLVVDEAHALGVFGPHGAGCWSALAASGQAEDVPLIRVGTFSKALGSYGGFVAGPAALIQLLVNRARGFIYSTALPPAALGAAVEALAILGREPDLGARLRERAAGFRAALRQQGLSLPDAQSPIVPVLLGENARALAVSQALDARGVVCTAIRPPTVPPGTARLRFSVTLGHTPAELRQAAATVARVL